MSISRILIIENISGVAFLKQPGLIRLAYHIVGIGNSGDGQPYLAFSCFQHNGMSCPVDTVQPIRALFSDIRGMSLTAAVHIDILQRNKRTKVETCLCKRDARRERQAPIDYGWQSGRDSTRILNYG